MAKTETKFFNLPEMRVINQSMFALDAFTGKGGQPGIPSYKIELAAPKEGVLDNVFEEILGFADEKFGRQDWVLNIDDPVDFTLISGVLDGDKLAKKREMNNKPGDAYKGMWVIRANTQFNRDGVKGPGGIAVYDEDVKLIPAIGHEKLIYPGMYGETQVSLGGYKDDDSGMNAVKFYLSAFQRTKDGERLVSPRDTAGAFKPRQRAAASTTEAAGRRSRRG